MRLGDDWPLVDVVVVVGGGHVDWLNRGGIVVLVDGRASKDACCLLNLGTLEERGVF